MRLAALPAAVLIAQRDSSMCNSRLKISGSADIMQTVLCAQASRAAAVPKLWRRAAAQATDRLLLTARRSSRTQAEDAGRVATPAGGEGVSGRHLLSVSGLGARTDLAYTAGRACTQQALGSEHLDQYSGQHSSASRGDHRLIFRQAPSSGCAVTVVQLRTSALAAL